MQIYVSIRHGTSEISYDIKYKLSLSYTLVLVRTQTVQLFTHLIHVACMRTCT